VIRRAAASATLAACASLATTALADPQWDVGLTSGVAGRGRPGSFWSDTAYYGSIRGDLIFGRSSEHDVGVGPALEIATTDFDDLRLLGGATAVLPLGDLFAVSATPSAYVRAHDDTTSAGVSGRLFLGFKSYNYESAYAMGAGLLLGYDQDLGGSKEHAAIVAVQLDALIVALPFALVYQLIRGPTH